MKEDYRIVNAVRLAEDCRKRAQEAEREMMLLHLRYKPLYENRLALCFFLDKIEEYRSEQQKLGNYEISDAIRKILPEMTPLRGLIFSSNWGEDFLKWKKNIELKRNL
jgi:hypothetical protein